MRDRATAFICGAMGAIIPNTGSILSMLGDFAAKAFTTAALGIVGGIAGLWAKEIIWPWIKLKFTRNENRNGPKK